MNIWNSISGMMTIEVTSAEPVAFLDQLTKAQIFVSGIQKKSELKYSFRIFRKDFASLQRIARKRSDRVTVLRRHGIYWKIKALLNRPVLILLFLFLTAATLVLPTRILFFEVSGNENIPAKQILAAAEHCGISFAASRSQVRSEKVKNELLSMLPQLQWAGINTSGCRAVISVRERTEQEPHREDAIVSDLISEQDGYVLSATVISGTAMVQPGDIITKGQILVSGYTDCGLYIQATRACGEILAQTNRDLTAVIPATYLVPGPITETKYVYSLLVGKKRINLWKDSRIFDAVCGRMYEEYFVTLPGGFQLPLALCIDRYDFYALQDVTKREAEVLQELLRFSDAYLVRRMTAGRILQKKQQLIHSEGVYILDSHYTCTEIIGKERREKIGEYDGKRS